MLKIVLLLIAVVLLDVASARSSQTPRGVVYQPCPNGWVTYEGSSSCYKVPSHPTNNWYEARKTCLSMGSDLVKITSTQENNYVAMLVHTYFPSTNYNSQFMWIGFLADSMVSKLSKRRFTWVDGTPLTGQYLNWGTGEPNNASEDCGSMFLHYEARSMKWNDLSCVHNTKIGYVCEKERHKRIYGGH